MGHIIIFILLSLIPVLGICQQPVEGMVLDKQSRQRIARVMLLNKTTGAVVYNSSRGEFSLLLSAGDELIVSKENYISDTLIYGGQQVLLIQLQRAMREIETVDVSGRRSAQEILQSRQRDYQKAYRLADPGDYVSVGQNGAGLSIGAVYNYFSREGRNARKLTRYFQQEYEQNYVDMVFTKDLVGGVLGLEGEPLENFMIRYRPSYDFVLLASRFELIKYIKTKYEYFKHIPYIKPLPDLKNIKLNLEQ